MIEFLATLSPYLVALGLIALLVAGVCALVLGLAIVITAYPRQGVHHDVRLIAWLHTDFEGCVPPVRSVVFPSTKPEMLEKFKWACEK